MNKNGEKEGKRSKGHKKDINKSTKVNSPKGGDNKVPADEKCREADDISNKFPNFSLLSAEERLLFYEALTTARKNVEKSGVLTRERFGTVHDEYLKYFNQEDKKEGCPDEASVAPNPSAAEDSADPPLGCSADEFHGGEPSKETKSLSPTLLLEGSSEAVVQRADTNSGRLQQQLSDECEAVIKQDTDKVMSMYLNKKKRNEEKSGERKSSQGGERKVSKLPKAEKKQQQQKKKDGTLTCQASETAPKTRDTPRFDALNAEEKDMFFNILQEARDNIVGKNPQRKGHILPLDTIVKRYTGQRPATTVYATRVQGSSRRCGGKKNLKVKVTLTSGDNERLQKRKSEDLCEREKEKEGEKEKEDIPSERRPSEDIYIDHICENEADAEDPVDKGECKKPKEKPSSQSVSGKLRPSSLTIDLKSSPALKNVTGTGGKTPPMEAKSSEANKKEDGNIKGTTKKQSYYAKVPKAVNEPPRNCPRGRRTNVSKPGDNSVTPSADEVIKQKKKKQQEEKEEKMQEPFYEGSLEQRPNLEEPEKECMEQEEKREPEKECMEQEEKEEPKKECLEQEDEGELEDECMEQEEEEGEEEEEEEESSCLCTARPESQAEACGIPREEKMCEGTLKMQVSSVVVSQDSWETPEEAQEEEEKRAEAGAEGSCFPGDLGGASSGEKCSLTQPMVKSLPLRVGGSAKGGECSGGEVEEGAKEEDEEGEGAKEEEEEKEEEIKEFSGMPNSTKVMIVDDNVIEKIRKLIHYLEAKAGKDDRLEKEYLKLLVDYVDYLSKVLEALAHKKERRKQVQRAYPAEVASLKFEEGQGGEKGKKEGGKFIPLSVSAQDLRHGGVQLVSRNPSEEKHKGKNQLETLSTFMSLSDSESSLESEQEARELPTVSNTKKVVTTKIRLLQDLLKQRAEFVQGSSDDVKIIQRPQEEYVPEERPHTVKLITEEGKERSQESHSLKLIKFLVKCVTCGKKKDDGEGIYDNLQGEAVRVDVCEGQTKDPANATLNLSTMEVLKSAKRKRIIDKYYGKN